MHEHRPPAAWLARRIAGALALLFAATALPSCDAIQGLTAKKEEAKAAADEADETAEEGSPKKKKKKSKKKSSGQEDAPVDDQPATPPPQLPVQPAIPQPPAAAPAVRLFTDATSVPVKLKEKVGGPVRILKLVLYPEYAIAQIQNPAVLEHVDEYTLRGGAVGDGVPVKFVGKKPSLKDLKDVTFDASELDWTAVPKMVADAPTQLKVEGGTVSHMILERPRPFDNAVRWRVYVSSARDDGSVVYDTKGAKVKVYD